jgi:hypothetical protein
MKKLTFLFFLTLISAISAGIAAQGREMPHVTQIQVEPRSNFNRITWVDSPVAQGPVFIFRSIRPFTDSVPPNIRPIVVNYGVQSFIDDTEDLGIIHYFVAASDTSGRRFDLILPRVNSTAENEGENKIVEIPAQPERIPPPDERIRGLSNLQITQNEDRVIITFDIFPDPSLQRRNAILYRSMHPIRQPQDLLNAIIVQTGISSPFIDFPVPGISWHYAVIFEDEIFSGNVRIRPGGNVSVSPIAIAYEQANERSLRPMPLPLMALRNTMPEGFFSGIPESTRLRSESVEILRNIQMPDRNPIAPKIPRVFVADLDPPTNSEESALFQIINEHFIKSEWENAHIHLQHFLSQPRTKDIEIRARFYLGQALYFTGQFRDALMEFLVFRTHHPEEAASWIQAVLSAMVH